MLKEKIANIINRLKSSFNGSDLEEIVIELLFLRKILNFENVKSSKFFHLPPTLDELLMQKKDLESIFSDLKNGAETSNRMNNFDSEDFAYDEDQFRNDVYDDDFNNANRTEVDVEFAKSVYSKYSYLKSLYCEVMQNLYASFGGLVDDEFKASLDELDGVANEDIKDFILKNELNLDQVDEYTPSDLSDLVIEMFSDKTKDSMLDLCSGKADFIIRAGDYKKHYSQDLYPQNVYFGQIKAFLADIKDYQAKSGDIFEEMDFKENNSILKVKNAFCHPTWIAKFPANKVEAINQAKWNVMKFEYSARYSPDWAYCSALINSLDKDGIGISIISNGSLLKMTDIDIRRQIIQKEYIKAVIQLPQDIFPYFAPESSIVVFGFNQESVKFIDARMMMKKGRRKNTLLIPKILNSYHNNTDFTFYKSYEEIATNDYILNVSSYLDKDIHGENFEILKPYIKDVFRGIQLTADELDKNTVINKLDGTEFQMATLSNINNDLLDRDMPYIRMNDNRLNRYLLENDDILISSKSTRIKTALVKISENEMIFASGNILVLRLDTSKLIPQYLKVYFDSKTGRKMLTSLQTGTVILSLNPSQIEKIYVPIPTLEKQKEIAGKYIALINMLKIYRNKLNKTEDEIFSLFDEEIGGVL